MVFKVLKFSAEWCGPCKLYESNFKQAMDLIDKSKVEYEMFDVEKNVEKTKHYNVTTVPTTIILNENQIEIDRKCGNISVNDLKSWIDSKYPM